jgi:hypothetical protein
MIPKTESTSPPDLTDTLLDILDRFQRFTILFFVVISLVSVAGIVVVNSHIWRYTRIHNFNISTGQYIAAGLHLATFYILLFLGLLSLWKVIGWILNWIDDNMYGRDDRSFREWHWQFLAWLMFVVVVCAVTLLITGKQSAATMVLLMMIVLFARAKVHGALKQPFSNTGVIFFAVFIAIAVVGGFLFGSSVYRIIPRSLGGGYPPTVQVIFKDTTITTALDLTITGSSQSDKLCLLAETPLDIIVYDATRKRNLMIPREIVLSVTDIRDDAQQIVCSPPALVDSILGEAFPMITQEISKIQ